MTHFSMASAAEPPVSPQEELNKLMQAQKQAQAELQKLLEDDQLQTPDSPVSKDDVQAITLGEEQRKLFEENAKKLQGLLDHPLTKELVKITSSPAFQKDIKTVAEHPKRNQLFYIELGWIVFMFFFRTWLFSHPAHWTRRVWTRIWTTLTFLGVSSYVIPVLLFGPPYVRVMDTLLGAVKVYVSK